jgi:uncharacterized repeat protein (TIGR01451 family)
VQKHNKACICYVLVAKSIKIGASMSLIAKLSSFCRLSRFSIAQTFGAFALMLGLLGSLAIPQVALAQTQITNTASISPPLGVTNTNSAVTCIAGTCTAADVDTVTPSLPLVSKTFTNSTIDAGGTSLLVITFTNTHKLTTATFSSAFVDAYPPNMFNAATPLAATTCLSGAPTAAANGTQVSLPAGTQIAPNSSCSVSVVVTSSTSPQAANTIPAGSLSTSVGANPTLITATLTVNPSANLAITKTTANSTPNAGGTFTYTIVIGNSGPNAVTNATWTDALPVNLGTITNIVPTGSITAGTAGNVISGTTTLGVGQVSTVTFQVTVAPGATGVLLNTATVAPPGTTTDPFLGNNSSTVPVTVQLAADMVITKTTSNATPIAGGTTSFTIVIGNNGPSAVTNATWTDTLPAFLGTITNIVPTGSVTAGTAGNVISGTATLLAGQVATVTFQVNVAANASGAITNSASVSPPGGTTELVPGNNSSSAVVTAGQVANLSVTKTDGVGSVVAGGTTAYTIVYSNGGPSGANGALVKDAASAGLVCTSVTCTTTTGGASCPTSLPTGTLVLSGATNYFGTGETIATFPANSSVTLVVNCNVTATGQ